MAEHFTARIERAKLATKTDIDNFVEKIDFDDIFKKLNKKLLQIKKNL